MRGLIFVGMLGPDSHNPEERRFVEELTRYFDRVCYLRGIGIKGLRPHQLASIPSRIAGRGDVRFRSTPRTGSLAIVPFRRVAASLNIAWLRRQLTRLVGGSPGEWTFWTRFPSPELVEAALAVPFARIVYEPIDLYTAAPNFSKREQSRMKRAESELSRHATVITGGRQLAERFQAAAGGSHWLPFGTDLDQPSNGRAEELLVAIGRPRLAVIGRLDWRLDEALLEELMRGHPHWNLILVGPRAQPWGNRLRRLKNVHWLGQRRADQARSILAGSDAALIPYRLIDWTRACLPVKVFDYLAEGKAVVSTPLPELEPFADVVRLVAPSDYGDAVEKALSLDTAREADSRRRAAARFTLQERARQVESRLRDEPLAALAR